MDLDRINEIGFERGSRWKTVVLIVCFSMWWNIFIVIQCYLVCLICTSDLAFQFNNSDILFFRYATDLCYLFELVCTLTYRYNPKFKKLKYNKQRGWFFLSLDIISIIPFEVLYAFHYVSDNKHSLLYLILIQNRLLRIYRIFQLEFLYGITVRKASQYVFFLFLQFTSKAVLISHILTCVWVNVKKSVPCDAKRYNCVLWYETNMAILVILNWSGKIKMFSEPWERVIAIAAILSGFILIFAHFYPYVLYVSMQLNFKRATYYEKYGKLQCFLRNMINKSELKEKVLHYFIDLWEKDRADSKLDTLLNNIPLALKKEIFTDIFWEAFRHSELLREVSRSCKRSLSLSMTTEYYHPGEVIFYKEQEKLKMIFLVQGIVQIMAEENKESPVLFFSSGTVLGELSLFLFSRSQALVKCKSYCELQILTMKAAARVLRDYPKDKRKIIHNLRRRINMSRYTQWRKQKFRVEQKMEMLAVDSSTAATEDCVKWFKMQWRALWENHQRHRLIIKAREEGFRLPSWHISVRPDIKVEHISNYLDLIVLSDVFEEKKDVVCLRTSFPWSIDPSAPFLKVWYYIILVTAFIPGLMYPFCTAWLLYFPWVVYLLSFPVTGIFQIDVILQLLTAIKTKHLIITKFSSILRQRLHQPTFYLDVVAALPYQLYIMMYIEVRQAESYVVGLLLHPAILKSHVFISLKVALGDHMDKITVFKNCMICLLLVYWFAEVIQLFGVREMLLLTNDDNWVDRILANKNDTSIIRNYYLSVFRALVTSISIPDYYMYPDEDVILVFFCFAKYFFFFFFCFFFGDFYGVYTVNIFSEETFQVLIKRIEKFLQSVYISSQIANRLLKSFLFQWRYDKADYFSGHSAVIKSMPPDLKRKVYTETTYKTLKSCRMFKDESLEFLMEVMERSFLVAVPSGSVLVTYGQTSHAVSILHRGYCQMNSYLTKDISVGLSHPVLQDPGSMFPMLSSFCNIPAPISVVTITDCEVIMINLDDLLTLMIKHKLFRDVVEVVRENKFVRRLQRAKPALVRLDANDGLEVRKEKSSISWSCKNCVNIINQYLVFNVNLARLWEILYSVYLLVVCALWPCCFGLFIYVSHIIIPIIFAGKIIVVVHIFFQFFAPYYNKMGILVTHPAYTSLNYLTTTFLLDFVCFFPIYHVYMYLIADPYHQPSVTMVLINLAQHYVKLIHIFGFLDNLDRIFNSKYFIRMTKIIIMFGLILNLLVNFVMFTSARWIYGGPHIVIGYDIEPSWVPHNADLIRDNSITDYYLYIAHWILSNMMTTDYLLHQASGAYLYISYIQSFLGTVIDFYLYAWISSNSIFGNIGGTIYQEKITSFVKYLEFEKADDKLIEYAISHYNHEWSQTQGENLKKVFVHLPIYLHEELVYPLYRPTIVKNKILAQADEGFYKILSMHVTRVYFNRGSVILFQNESQSDIYFVHKGKCFVYDWFLILDTGSLVGDIKRTGLMENKIYALTHVEMLKISSNDFFMIINNFDDLETEFVYKTRTSENFIECELQNYDYQLRPVDSRDVLNAFGLKNRDIGFEDESYFEDPDNSSVHLLKMWKSTPEEKLRFLVLYPGTWKMKLFVSVYLTVTFFTLLFVPTFMSLGTLSIEAFVVIGILDFFWFLVILYSFRVGYIDKVKGDVITDFKFIAKQYAKRWDGLVVDILALIPFEIVPIITAGGLANADVDAVAWLRAFRLLRGKYFLKNIKRESRKLKGNNYLRFLHLLLHLIVWFSFLLNIFIAISSDPMIAAARDPYSMGYKQFFAFVVAFEFVINFIASSNLCVIIPSTMTEIIYLNFNALFCPYIKGWIISQVLSILYVRGLATSFYKFQVIALESYLESKDTSPAIVKEVLNYKLNLLLFSRSENMPSFLKKAPASLRIAIMKDLYLPHIMNCPLFQHANIVFLEQLVARLKREIYFPGQKIVEQNDVDHRMYFIHIGEVYVIKQTKDRAYVEYLVGKLSAGEYFGESQGLRMSLPHKHTFRARTLVELVVLHSDDWSDLRRSFPTIAAEVFAKARALRIT